MPDRETPAAEGGHSELRVLYDTIRDLTSTLSVREVLDRLLRRALDHLDAEIGSILVLCPDQKLRIAAAYGLPEDVVKETEIELSQGISGYVALSGRPLLVRDVEADDRFARRNHERYYTRSFLSAPLLHMGAVRGVINLNNKRSREDFSDGDLLLLEALSGHASVALANAHRYEAVLAGAQRDSLTGLANHGFLWATLEREFERALRHGRSLAIVLLDLDNFQDFNAHFGHRAGDEALCTVARYLEANSRAHDVTGRYGGEEFAVILPETDLDGATRYAEKLRRAVAGGRFDPNAQRLTLSAGVACLGPGVATAQDLVSRAAERLAEAKRDGRNRVAA